MVKSRKKRIKNPENSKNDDKSRKVKSEKNK